jgi:hypothetical protein
LTDGLNPDPIENFIDDEKDTPLEDIHKGTFPKLEKLSNTILLVLNQADKISNLTIQKVPSKVFEGKEKKKKSENVQPAKKYSIFEEELIQALKNEKNKFK